MLLELESSVRVLQVLLTSCLQGSKGTAFNLFSNWSFPHTPYIFPLSVSCRLLSRHSVRTSWEFSLEEVGISPTYQVTYLHRGRIKVPHLMSKRPIKCWLATLNASSAIMSHALEQINAARIGVICQGASSAPHFLLARLQGYSFQFVFQLVFPAYTLHLPSICVLPTAFKTFCSNKLGILTGRSWHFSNISSDISAWWSHESTSLDVSKASGMLTSHAKRIFSDNVTCFGKNKSCSNRSHLPQCFIKALRFLLAWLNWCLHGHTCKKLEKGSRR